jgi:hypothetical protein
MTDWIPNDKELQAVLSLNGIERYNHLIKKVVDQEQVWSLWHDNGWALASDDTGQQLVPIWPHSKYAGLCATGAWTSYRPKAISLEDWQIKWIPGMIRDRRIVAVFPTPASQGVTVSPNRIEHDLSVEMSNYE